MLNNDYLLNFSLWMSEIGTYKFILKCMAMVKSYLEMALLCGMQEIEWKKERSLAVKTYSMALQLFWIHTVITMELTL